MEKLNEDFIINLSNDTEGKHPKEFVKTCLFGLVAISFSSIIPDL